MPLTKGQRDEIKQCLLDCLTDKDFMLTLAEKVAEVVGTTLGDHLAKLDGQVSELQGQVASNQEEIRELKMKLNYFEQNHKLKQLRLYGLREETDENLSKRVQETLSKVMKIGEIPIENCYRMKIRSNNDQKPRPLVIQFTSIKTRNEVFYRKKLLKGSALVITEELTKSNYELLQLGKVKFGMKDAWSREGKIFVKLKGKIHNVRSREDLEKLLK
ncbi:hypothetical protein WA026_022801 [Henosepilachna vigintioctopunctata]|uniref:Uncharacterized protein n=1 Tax=Henosepilachna vigintioctopunctata TaxID=420089 RepID=A0AAW1VB66_9CUCU